MQRCDLKVSLMTWDVAWDQNTWGMGDFYGQRGHAFDRELMRKYITSTMQGPEKFDVMILPTPIGWKDADWDKAVKKLGWKSVGHGGGTRLCTHYGIEREDIKAFVDGLAKQVK